MAKKDKSASRSEVPAGGAGRFGRYCLILVLAGSAALAWASLLTYSPTDPPAKIVVPPKRPVDNLAGVVGAYVAHSLLYWVGGGAYMALLFVTVAAAVMACGGRVGELPWRVLGVVLLVVATSSAIYMVDPVTSGDPLTGSAGILGIAVGRLLLTRLATVGGWIVLLVSFGIGLMLAADHLVLQLPSLGRRAWEQREKLSGWTAALRRRSPEAAGAGGGSATVSGRSRPRPVTARPVRPGSAKPDAGEDAEGASARRPTPPGKPEAEKKDADKADSGSGGVGGLVRRLLPGGADDADDADEAPAARAAAKPKSQPAAKPKPAPPPRPAGGASSGGAAKAAATNDGDGYILPPQTLLEAPTGGYIESQEHIAAQRRQVLQQTLDDFSVTAEVVGHQTGPVITLFELSLAPGVKVSRVANLANDIARALAVPGVRIVSPLPGRDTVGIEVPNDEKEIVRIRQLMQLAGEADNRMHLPLYLGKDAGGEPIVEDLARMPHMLIAGTTGSGKSVCINSIIIAMLMTRRPEEVRLILVDPKMVEMAAFEQIPHLLCPIVNDMHKAEDILEWAATKMDERYELLKEAGVRNIAGYNKLSEKEIYERFGVETDEEKARVPTRMPYYVVIVDELADLIMTSSKEVENHIIRIAQKARAVGIHLILATQRPSVNVVTGLIKSNMPCRASFRVASRQESRIVLDQNGAEVLLGQGDMLFLRPGTSTLIRAQGTFVDDEEIRAVVKSLARKSSTNFHPELMALNSKPAGDVEGERDELFDKAVEIVLQSQRGSVSLLQRRLAVGYSRASRIIDQMAEAGLLGDYKGSQARECMMTLEEWHEFKASVDADQSGANSLNGEPTSV